MLMSILISGIHVLRLGDLETLRTREASSHNPMVSSSKPMRFGMLPFFPRGCYVSISDCGKIKQVLAEYAECMLPKDSWVEEVSN